MSAGLQIRRFGVAFGDRVVLSHIHLDVPRPGMVVLLGPAGVGKSTLLRTIAGHNAAQPALRTWGSVSLDGEPMAEETRPALVMQNARLLVSSIRENLVSALPNRSELVKRQQNEIVQELLNDHGLDELGDRVREDVFDLPLQLQRRLAIVRAVAGGASMIFVDEPTAGLSVEDGEPVLDLLERLAERLGVVVVTHHIGHARRLGGRTALLASGRIVEEGTAARVLEAPQTPEAREFVSRGSCSAPSPSARSGDLAEGVPAPTPIPLRFMAGGAAGPREFYWIDRGRLGGLPRPGVVAEMDHDLDALQQLGVTVLITLEEQRTVPAEALAARGIRGIFFPIPDMEAPESASMRALCERVEALLESGDVVAVHCLAGLGRTGTVLAAMLIHRGATALEAIEAVRQAKARAIQSNAQVEFLADFAVENTEDGARSARPATRENGAERRERGS